MRARVAGSGKRGQVLKGDVLDAIGKGSASAAAPPPRLRVPHPRRTMRRARNA
jgi:hypothetical protein